MATKVHMEALSPTMEEGQIVRWLKSEGDEVTNGDVLAEIETDKATMELVARGDGILRAVLLGEGETAAVGQVIGVIAGADEDIGELTGGKDGGKSSKSKSDQKMEDSPDDEAEDGEEGDKKGGKSKSDKKMKDSDGAAEGEEEEDGEEVAEDEAEDEDGGEDEGESAGSGAQVTKVGYGADQDAARRAGSAPAENGDGRIKASPLARRLATEAGIDLSDVSGSGPGGRIVKADVEKAKSAPAADRKAPAAERPSTPKPAEWSDAGATESHEEVKVSQMRKTIARRLTESLSPVPHFFLTIEVDMTRIMSARERVNEVVSADGDKISVNDFLLKATAGALRKHPNVNSAWHGDVIRRFDHVHIGVAVAVEDGLITPIVKHADRKGLVQISREVKELAGRARVRKLKPEEYTGATFSISNLGMFGIREFTAIINPPEAGILAIGETKEIPVVEDGEVVVRPMMRVTMSCDHRVIDGASGAQFLATLRAMLEEPTAILI